MGVPQNLMEGGLSQNMRGTWGKLKILSKNTCEGVHLTVKLLPISLKACKCTHIFQGFWLAFKLLFISWKGVLCFNGGGGGGVVFQMKGFIFKWRGAPWASVLVGGGFEKTVRWRRGASSCPSAM